MKFDSQQFTNIDSEKFIGMWGGESYPLEAGETKLFPSFLIDHFCKHLADKILNRENRTSDELRRGELITRMKSGVVVKAEKIEKQTEGQKVKEEVQEAQKEVEGVEAKRKEEIKLKRIEALKKARAAKVKK